MELLQSGATLLGGCGQCSSRKILPHYPGTLRNAIPAMHCPTARGQWGVELLQCTATLPRGCGVQLLQYTTSLPRGSGRWDSYKSTASLPRGSGKWNPYNAVPHRLGAVGSAIPIMHCRSTWGPWAAQLLQCGGPPSGGDGQSHPGGDRYLKSGILGKQCHTA